MQLSSPCLVLIENKNKKERSRQVRVSASAETISNYTKLSGRARIVFLVSCPTTPFWPPHRLFPGF